MTALTRFLVNSYNNQAWASQPFTITSRVLPPSTAITSPTASTIWFVNSTVQITWNPAVVKNENGTLRSIGLYNATSQLPLATLASNFASNTGSVSVTVPDVNNGTYRIVSEYYSTPIYLALVLI